MATVCHVSARHMGITMSARSSFSGNRTHCHQTFILLLHTLIVLRQDSGIIATERIITQVNHERAED